MTRTSSLLLALGLLVAAASCKGSFQKESLAESRLDTDSDQGFDATTAETLEAEAQRVQGAPTTAGSDFALVGARPDVDLAVERPVPTCKCLAAYAGSANDPAFFWEDVIPRVDERRHVVLAMTTEGLGCDPSVGAASYWGYVEEGRDVIVYLERVAAGVPVTRGAIVPRPQTAGHLYVVPRRSTLPFGQSLIPGQKLCAVAVSEPRVESSTSSSSTVPDL